MHAPQTEATGLNEKSPAQDSNPSEAAKFTTEQSREDVIAETLHRANDSALTVTELTQLADLEAAVDRGRETFIEVGLALAEIREARLYRQSHRSFSAYVADRFGFTGRRGSQLITSAKTVSQLGESGNHGSHFLSERAARELSAVPEHFRQAVVDEAVSVAGTDTLTGSAIAQAWRKVRFIKSLEQLSIEAVMSSTVWFSDGEFEHTFIVRNDDGYTVVHLVDEVASRSHRDTATEAYAALLEIHDAEFLDAADFEVAGQIVGESTCHVWRDGGPVEVTRAEYDAERVRLSREATAA